MAPVHRLLIFTKGGLLGIIDFSKERVEFLLEWPEDTSIGGMALVATLMSILEKKNSRYVTFEDVMQYALPEIKILFGEKGIKVLRKPLWVAYIGEDLDYIIIAEYKKSEDKDIVIDFPRRLSIFLKDIPEEAILVCTESLKFAWQEFGMSQ